MEITVSVDKEFKNYLSKSWLRKIFRAALKAVNVPPQAEANLLITDTETIRRLNREYRGEDEATDVLAFSMLDQPFQGDKSSFVSPPDGVLHLGEVIISYPQAAKQAMEHGHSLEQELIVLLVHGLLHLLGYDHEQPEPGRQMQTKEKELVVKVSSLLGRT